MTLATTLRRNLLAAIGAGLALAACSPGDDAGGNNSAAGEQVVNLYSARHYDSDKALYQQFTEATGIRVNVIEGNADELIARMRAEGANSPADLFVTADAGALWRAEQAELLQPVNSEVIEQRIPANLREPSGLWTGFMRRARVVAYDSAKVRENEVETYEQLASPRFRGRLCVRSSDNIYNLSLVGALIEAWGPEKTREWANGIVANMARPPEGGDRDQIRAVNAGVCEVALTNSYYYIRMASGEDQAERAITQKVRLGFPSLDGEGSHINISGGGVAANAPNRDNAIRLLEFFTAPGTQEYISANNNEYPASPTVTAPVPVSTYTGFQPNPMPVADFARHQPEAQKIMSAAGWR